MAINNLGTDDNVYITEHLLGIKKKTPAVTICALRCWEAAVSYRCTYVTYEGLLAAFILDCCQLQGGESLTHNSLRKH